MLTFFGNSCANDSQIDCHRLAELAELETYFDTGPPKALTKLECTALSKRNEERGTILVALSDGQGLEFGGTGPSDFADLLCQKGLEEGAFDALYLLASNHNLAPQKTGTLGPFAAKLHQELENRQIGLRIFATRGTLSYTMIEEQKDGKICLRATDMCITTPGVKDPASGQPYRYRIKDGLQLASRQ